MLLNNYSIVWVDSFKYLGVHADGETRMTFDILPVKHSFYSACNIILAHAKSMDQLLHLSLQEKCTLPILTYAAAAIPCSDKQIKDLDVC